MIGASCSALCADAIKSHQVQTVICTASKMRIQSRPIMMITKLQWHFEQQWNKVERKIKYIAG